METTPGAEPVPARKEPAGGARRLRLYARPVLIGGIVLAVVGAVLLLVVTGLDAFNATVYSVGGKSISDATAEAQSLRDQFQGARAIGLAVLIVGAVAIVGSAIALYATRSLVAEDDGDDLGYDELAGE
ncbi:hypothetical protein GCM10012320_12990 [Sinomonas cellulolyticus]|uniref:Dinucleotide-utilizing enzyme n=1 Tax=Sinomonas cellulolyticus TaxID=2801916 RepID=A0ABS1JZG0_9MICC|nr:MULTISPECIES: hypothetical protein [Sinomonas]MBL0704735.1 hypothetical protein [Sinomonas cellulolyticus]GHG46758.1 hypothetical protein GCM10012320_12990 [Sinomonas sp. KCTC 49339]